MIFFSKQYIDCYCKRRVDAIYPRDPNDENFVSAEMDKVGFKWL